MKRIDKKTIVQTSIDNIFDYIGNPNNWPEVWPSLVEIKNVQLLPNGGYSARWVYKMAGMTFQGTGEYTEVTPNQWLIIKTKGGIKSTITWTFRSEKNRTRVFLTIDYNIPIPLLGQLAEIAIMKINEQEIDLMMHSLRSRFLSHNRLFES